MTQSKTHHMVRARDDIAARLRADPVEGAVAEMRLAFLGQI